MMRIDPMTQDKAVWLDRDGQPIPTARAEAAGDRQRGMTRRTLALLAAANEAVAEPGWYALTVKDRAEQAVREAIEDATCWMSWIATEAVTYRRRGRRVDGERAAYPGYVFVRVAWSAQACHWLQSVDGLFGVIGGWEAPKRIGEREFVEVKDFFTLTPAQRKREAAKRLGIVVDDDVVISDGPLAGIKGKVVAEADPVSMWVEIKLFGGLTRSRVDLANLTRIGVPSRP